MPTTLTVSILVIFAVGELLAAWPGRATLSLAHRHARRINLELKDEQERVVTRRVGRRARFGALGAVVAMVAVWLPAVAWRVGPFVDSSTGMRQGNGDSTFSTAPIAVVLAFFLGQAMGSAAVAWWEALRPVRTQGARVARASRPGPGDYVAPIERVGSWVLVAVDAVLVLSLLALRGPLDLPALPFGLTVAVVALPAIAVVLQEWLAARLVNTPQAATSPVALAWDDAMRAMTLRDVVTVTLALGLYGPFVLLGVLSEDLTGGWPANPAVGVVDGIFVALLVAALVTAVVATASAPWGHFRRRLWPIEAAA